MQKHFVLVQKMMERVGRGGERNSNTRHGHERQKKIDSQKMGCTHIKNIFIKKLVVKQTATYLLDIVLSSHKTITFTTNLWTASFFLKKFKQSTKRRFRWTERKIEIIINLSIFYSSIKLIFYK